MAEKRTAEQFMTHFRGVPTFRLVQAMQIVFPGVNWSRCSKAIIAEEWATETLQKTLKKHRGRIMLADIDAALVKLGIDRK